MSRVRIEDGQLIITVQGARKFFAVKSELSVPLANVQDVTTGLAWKDTPVGIEKRVGTDWFGYFGGSFAQEGKKVFYDIKKKEEAVVITLKDEDFESLIIGTDDPAATVALIKQSLPTPLSYTQEYYLCAVSAKGRLSLSKGTEIDCAFFAGAIMELLEHGFVKTDENECIVCDKPFDEAFAYLRPLYDFIKTQKKPRALKDLCTDWMICFKLRNKTWDELREAIGLSLADRGDVEELANQGLLRNKTRFAPKAEAVAPIVKRIRTELLEDGNITQETVCLAAFLDNSRLLGNYFSKADSEELKKRLEKLKDNEAFATAQAVTERITLVLTAVTAAVAASAAAR
jgi:hypothetical protein